MDETIEEYLIDESHLEKVVGDFNLDLIEKMSKIEK